MSRVPARGTDKAGLVGSVLPITVAAGEARLRRVSRIDHHERNPRPLRLVGEKVLQLAEGPAARPGALSLGEPYPRPNVPQILDGNPALRAFGKTDNLFTDDVVFVPLESRLFPTEPQLCATDTARPLASFALSRRFPIESPATVVGAQPNRLNGGTCENLAITRHGDVGNPEVDADEFGDNDGRWIGNIGCHVEVEPAVAINEVRFTLEVRQQTLLILPNNERDASAPANKSHAYRGADQSHVPGVERHRTGRSEDRTGSAIAAERFDRFRNCLICEPRGEPEVGPDASICESCERRPAILSRRESLDCCIVRSGVDSPHRIEKHGPLFSGRIQGALNGEFHTPNIPALLAALDAAEPRKDQTT